MESIELLEWNAPPMENTLDESAHRLLSAILEISNFVGSVMQTEDILRKIVEITADLLQVPVCSVYLIDDGGQLIMRSNVGFEHDLLGQAAFDYGEGVPGWVAKSGEMLALKDAPRDERHRPMASSLEVHCRAYMCAPLRIQDEIIGVMTARRNHRHEWTPEEMLFFETVCKQVAIVLEKSRMYEDKIDAERLAAVALSLSGIAHYIKNLMTSIKGSEYIIDKVLQRNGDTEQLRQSWTVLKRGNRKISELVYNMLNYSRKTEPERKCVNLNKMIAEIVETVRETASLRNIEVMTELGPGCENVMLDGLTIYDALLNLVTNGMDAVPEDRRGRLIVHTERLDGQNVLRIDVIDNGAGISEENKAKIFNLFFSTKGGKGTGIGLAATKKIVMDHGGTIECESKAGHGTHFTVFLPAIDPEDECVECEECEGCGESA